MTKMNFEQAEVMYHALRSRFGLRTVMGRAEFEEQVGALAFQDANGTWWEIHPYNAQWMYYDGLQWVLGVPPGRKDSAVPSISPINSANISSAPLGQAKNPSSVLSTAQKTAESEQGLSWRRAWNPQGVPRFMRRSSTDSNRIWILFAAVSMLLFGLACLIFFGGQIVLSGFSQQMVETPTRVVRLSTSTPVPTMVRQPTLPPATTTPLPVVGKIIEPRVNVRAEPNLSAKIIGRVVKDDLISIISLSQDGAWFQVRIGDLAEPSWIFAETIEITGGDVKTLPIVK